MAKDESQTNSYYRVKPILEKALGVVFGTLAVFQLFFTMSNYVIDGKIYSVALKIDRYLALAAVLGVAVYVVVMMTRYRLHAKSAIVPHIKRLFSGANLWVTLLFLWYLAACTVLSADESYIFKMNDRFLLDTFISFFVLYMIPWNRKTYDWFIHILMAVETVFMVWVLYNNFKLNILTVPGGQIGMAENYSLVIACNRNTTGAFAAVFLMLALYMVSVQKGVLRWAYAAAAVIQLFPLYLSNSRTAYLACVITIAAAGFFLVQRKYTGKYKSLLAVGCGLLCGAVIYFLKYGVMAVYDGVTHLSEYLGVDGVGIRDVDLLNTSGRLVIWKTAVKAMFLSAESFMVGVTPAGVEAVLGYLQNVENYAMYTHNQFLQMGVAFGIPGLAVFCVWLLKMAKQCWKVAFHGRYWMLSCMILMLVLSNMMESYLVAYFYFCGSVFFLVCGMVKAEADELTTYGQAVPQTQAKTGKKAKNKKKR